jgi:hypothetical protein
MNAVEPGSACYDARRHATASSSEARSSSQRCPGQEGRSTYQHHELRDVAADLADGAHRQPRVRAHQLRLGRVSLERRGLGALHPSHTPNNWVSCRRARVNEEIANKTDTFRSAPRCLGNRQKGGVTVKSPC